MLPLAITFYDVVLTVHIIAVVVAFGVIFAYPVMDAVARRAGPADLAALHRLQVALGRRVIIPDVRHARARARRGGDLPHGRQARPLTSAGPAAGLRPPRANLIGMH